MREEAASYNNYSQASEIYGKRKKRYVDHPKDWSKLTCIIHGPGNLSDECKVLGDFVNKYNKVGFTKDHMQDNATKKSCGIQQENNAITQHAVA